MSLDRPFVTLNVAVTADGKTDTIDRHGATIHVIRSNPYNRFYLETKATKSGHLIDFAGKEHLPEQSDRPAFAGMPEEQVAALQDL